MSEAPFLPGRLDEEQMLEYLRICKQKALALYFYHVDLDDISKMEAYLSNEFTIGCPFCHYNIEMCAGEYCEIYHICGNEDPKHKPAKELLEHILQFKEMIDFIEGGEDGE